MFRISASAALLLVVLLALACGGSDDNSGDGTGNDAQDGDIQSQIDNLRTQFSGQQSRIEFHDDRAVRSEMLTAMLTLYVEDLDGFVEEINSASEIPAGAADKAERMRRAVQLVFWGEQFQERATNLIGNLDSLWDAIFVDNLELAQESASNARELWHEMEAEIYLEIGGPRPDHEHNPDGSHESPAPTS